MTKKILNTEGITNELKGASLFFSKPAEPKPELVEKTENAPLPVIEKRESLRVETKPEQINKDTDKHASMHASKIASTQDETVERVRKIVKQVGKDIVYLRLTASEKRDLSSVVYTLNELYQGEIRKTSENEIGRIGLNFLLADYEERGEGSILAKVLKALNA